MAPQIPSNERTGIAAPQGFQSCDKTPGLAFDRITSLTAKLLKAPIASVCLVDEQVESFKFCGSLNADNVSCRDSFYPYVIAHGDVMVVEDATKDGRFSHSPFVVNEPYIRFYAGVPLIAADGIALGILSVMEDQSRDSFSPENEETLRILATVVMAEIEARRCASIEPITGLGNRARFTRDLEALMTSEIGDDKIFIIAADISDPVTYNKMTRALGSSCVDQLMTSAAQFLKSALPPESSLYHIGDFRFAMLLKAKTISAIQDMTERLIVGLRQPVVICGGIPVTPNAHIGIAQFPEDSDDGLELERAAVTAASDAREQNIDSVYYKPKHDQAYKRAFRLLTDVPAALGASDQLALQYQPKIDLQSGACVGVEALLRWRHPALGMVPPTEFIPLVEETALIKPITEWVLDEALKQLALWRADGINTKVAVNISTLNLADVDFPQYIGQRLNHHGLEADSIQIEITESALMTDFSVARRQLEAIRRLGIDIAIDDFGTGQSAISYLKKIPANAVKIDQSFIGSLLTDRVDGIIVKSMIELAHNLGFLVIAEGIETAEILQLLEKWSCNQGQGYFIAQPLDPDAFSKWHRKRSGGRHNFDLGPASLDLVASRCIQE